MTQVTGSQKKINNFQAQLHVVTTNLSKVVGQINEAVELKEGYLLEIENLEDELSDKHDELFSLCSALKNVEQQIKEADIELIRVTDERLLAEQDLEALKRALGTIKRETEGKVQVAERKLLEVLETIKSKQAEFNTERLAHCELLDNLQEDVEITRSEIAVLEEKGQFVTKKVEESLRVLEEQEQKLEKRAQFIVNRENELKKIAEDYHTQRILLDQREADLRVYERRIRKSYEETFPGRKVNIT